MHGTINGRRLENIVLLGWVTLLATAANNPVLLAGNELIRYVKIMEFFPSTKVV